MGRYLPRYLTACKPVKLSQNSYIRRNAAIQKYRDVLLRVVVDLSAAPCSIIPSDDGGITWQYGK
jgi:hypothetical protein